VAVESEYRVVIALSMSHTDAELKGTGFTGSCVAADAADAAVYRQLKVCWRVASLATAATDGIVSRA
jgi:hypothetical protein